MYTGKPLIEKDLMIRKGAVKEFIEKISTFDDSDVFKNCTDAELSDLLDAISPSFVTTPMRHQLVSFCLAVSYKRYLLFLDMGLGKSKVSLDTISYFMREGSLKKTLVVVPFTTNLNGWVQETAIHQPSLRISKDWDDIEADIIVITYAGLNHKASTKVKEGSKNVLKPDNSKITVIKKRFDGFIFDESTAIKNHLSLQFKVAHKISKHAELMLCLTGTPFDKNPTDFWSQFKVTDGGETLGEALGMFRAAFCSMSQTPWATEYKFDKRWVDHFNKRIRNRAVWYSEDECPDLPQKVYQLVPVDLPTKTLDYYRLSLKQVRNQAKSDSKETSLGNSFMHLRNLCSSFISLKDPETGEKDIIKFEPDPKLEAIDDLISGFDSEEQVIIFCAYVISVEKLVAYLNKKKITTCAICSKSKDKIEDFEKGKSRVLVATNAAAYGLNLQMARRVIFYESFSSCLVRRQAEKRAHRKGQEKTVYYYDVYVRDSIEEKILEALSDGEDLFKMIVEGRAGFD